MNKWTKREVREVHDMNVMSLSISFSYLDMYSADTLIQSISQQADSAGKF